MSTASGVPFPMLCKLQGLPPPVAEYMFALSAGRAWRFDWCWPDGRVALEVEGGAWVGGRHVRPRGYLEDMAKYNHAAATGWLVLRCTPDALASVATLDLVRQALEAARS